MAKRNIVVAVDSTDASVAAAQIGLKLAESVGDDCKLVHVTADVSRMPATVPPIEQMDELMKNVQAAARQRIDDALRGAVPDNLIDGLEVRMGRAAWILPFIVEEFDARLLVLGRKRHVGPVRWFGGSTVHHVVRTVDVPILVVDETLKDIKRMLVAVDNSHAAPIVLKGATEFASLTGAEIKIINVIEPVPYLGEFPAPLDDAGYAQWAQERFDNVMDKSEWKSLDRVVQQGPVTSSIVDEAERWQADVVVAGTHGAGWLDRLLLGSTTQRLLNRLSGSLYVVPVGPPSKE